MNLFNEKTFDVFLEDIRALLDDIINKQELPQRGLILIEKIGHGKETSGKIISFSIVINEPKYPAKPSELLDSNRTQTPILSFNAPKSTDASGSIEMSVDYDYLHGLELSHDIVMMPQTKSSKELSKQRIKVRLDSPNLLQLINDMIEFRIRKYHSSADAFGCCDMFEKCSDAKKCVHENKLYSTVCAYRQNLEKGKIFYGKNKNI